MKSFSFTVVLTTLVLLSSVGAINWRIMNPSFENFLKEAGEWQLRTRGVIQTGGYSREFKYLMTNHRKEQLQTVILGSSQVFGLRAPTDNAYNLASEGNRTACMVQEAFESVAQIPNLKKIILSVDLFREFRTDPQLNCPPASFTKLVPKKSYTSIFQISTVLNWDITVVSAEFVSNRFISPVPLRDFWSANEYPCPNENTLGKDMFFLMPGKCYGFRFDGSSTFAYLPKDIDLITMTNFLPMKDALEYQFNPQILEMMIAKLDGFLKKGGEILFLLPPIYPGFEKTVGDLPKTNGTYWTAKEKFLNKLKSHANVRVIDASASEKFGCTENMFLDVTHALNDCFEKIKLF